MTAICGLEFPRRADHLALAATVVAIVSSVVAPMLYVVAAPLACGVAALAAPAGHRSVTALAVWVTVSASVTIGVAPVG